MEDPENRSSFLHELICQLDGAGLFTPILAEVLLKC